MAIDRVAMPEQDPAVRAVNFREVNLGLTQQIAMLEAERCLQCPKPYCIGGCPVSVNIPRFLKLLREGDLPGAADSLLDDNALPCVTGRVCPQENQCEGVCLRAKKGNSVAIGHLERFVADWAQAHPEELDPRSAAAAPARRSRSSGPGRPASPRPASWPSVGHDVTIFEAFHAAGGVLVYGIPEFRLPKDIVQAEVDRLVADGRQDRPEFDHRQDVHAAGTARAVRRGLPRGRRRAAGLHGRPGREPQGRLLGQRVPDPGQPHGRLEPGLRDAGPARSARGRRRRRERRDGLGPDGPAAGCRRGA